MEQHLLAELTSVHGGGPIPPFFPSFRPFLSVSPQRSADIPSRQMAYGYDRAHQPRTSPEEEQRVHQEEMMQRIVASFFSHADAMSVLSSSSFPSAPHWPPTLLGRIGILGLFVNMNGFETQTVNLFHFAGSVKVSSC